MRQHHRAVNFTSFILIIGIVLFGCAAGPQPDAPEGPDRAALDRPPVRYQGLEPVRPQPKSDALKPGLAVAYHHHYFARSLNPLSKGYVQDKPGNLGKPVLSLNQQFGRNEVFGSGAKQGVGVRMQGLLNFPRQGEYTLHAVSNDGLRIYIANTMVIEDPSQHSDRYAVPAAVKIEQAGWYPFKLEYFQRKGTATLQLFWRKPDAEDFTGIPSEALAHREADIRSLKDY